MGDCSALAYVLQYTIILSRIKSKGGGIGNLMTRMNKFAHKLEGIADQSKLREAAAGFEQSCSYINSNRENLLKQYPNHWIAVHKFQVLAADKDLRNLINTLRRKGIHLEQVAVELLTSEQNPILL